MISGEIRAALKAQGCLLVDVDRKYLFSEGTTQKIVNGYPHKAGEAAIAEVIGKPAHKIWPSRYDAKTGKRLRPQPAQNYHNGGATAGTRTKRGGAEHQARTANDDTTKATTSRAGASLCGTTHKSIPKARAPGSAGGLLPPTSGAAPLAAKGDTA